MLAIKKALDWPRAFLIVYHGTGVVSRGRWRIKGVVFAAPGTESAEGTLPGAKPLCRPFFLCIFVGNLL
jgi:hypothetical protein